MNDCVANHLMENCVCNTTQGTHFVVEAHSGKPQQLETEAGALKVQGQPAWAAKQNLDSENRRCLLNKKQNLQCLQLSQEGHGQYLGLCEVALRNNPRTFL